MLWHADARRGSEEHRRVWMATSTDGGRTFAPEVALSTPGVCGCCGMSAAVTERRAELVRAYTAVQNAQERIQALVNDPALASIAGQEMIPADTPTREMVPVDMQDEPWSRSVSV